MSDSLFFQWSVSNLFGWGVYGLNLLRHWQEHSGAQAFCIGHLDLESLRGMDPLALRALAQPLVDSDVMRLKIESGEVDLKRPVDGIMLHSLGNYFNGSVTPRDGGVTGRMTAGVIFFEDTNLPDAREICGSYDLIVTGATWCEEVLRERGVENVATVIQGVDLSTFHPAPRAHHLRDRFTIFSGGKMEHRKGQDLVILAFRAFAQRHPEALLVTAWHSPWSTPALTLNGNAHLSPVVLKEDGAIDMAGWIAANGIPADNYFDLGKIPNHQMARVVREMDVALFPNRCEGGTNLVAMECMACGIPTILSDNTGHKDLTSIEGVYRLERQGVVTPALEGIGCEGWGESDVDEIVERLEEVWSAKEESRRRGLIGAEAMARLSWRNQIGELSRVLRA